MLVALPSKQKLPWTGVLVSVQPRIRLSRSFDERAHSYLGFVLGVAAEPNLSAEFVVALGNAAQAKHEFRRGDLVSGEGVPVADERLEVADLYKASKLQVISRAASPALIGPPWQGAPPPLEVYRQRGHCRLDVKTCAAKCSTSTLWLQNGRGDRCESLERGTAEVPHRNLLLRAAVLLAVARGAQADGARAQRHEARRRGLGGRGRHRAAGAGRVNVPATRRSSGVAP